MKIYGNAMPGGSLTTRGIPTPTQPIPREGRDAWSLTEARRPRPSVAVPGATTGQIRAWGIARGYPVARNGAIPQQVRDAYQQAVKTGESA